MTGEWTCGKGLAAHAELPVAIGELMAAMATMLERHTLALDPGQSTGRAEYAAYFSLAARHRLIAEALQLMGKEMTGYATLPMAEHDMDKLMSGVFDASFRAVVAAEEALLNQLRQTLAEHQQMLVGE